MIEMKKFLALFALLIAATAASASSLQIAAGATPISFSGFNPAPNLGLAYNSGHLGKLEALSAGVFTATYLGQESGYRNGFSFQDGSFRLGSLLSGYEAAISLNEYSAVGSSIYSKVQTGILDFWFRDDRGGFMGNDGFSYKKASFAILDGKCLTSYGCFSFLLGFDDSGGGLDRDFDDFVVGVNLTPVPLPAAAWLFGSALIGFVTLSRRRRI
jgi:hypothetical protein